MAGLLALLTMLAAVPGRLEGRQLEASRCTHDCVPVLPLPCRASQQWVQRSADITCRRIPQRGHCSVCRWSCRPRQQPWSAWGPGACGCRPRTPSGSCWCWSSRVSLRAHCVAACARRLRVCHPGIFFRLFLLPGSMPSALAPVPAAPARRLQPPCLVRGGAPAAQGGRLAGPPHDRLPHAVRLLPRHQHGQVRAHTHAFCWHARVVGVMSGAWRNDSSHVPANEEGNGCPPALHVCCCFLGRFTCAARLPGWRVQDQRGGGARAAGRAARLCHGAAGAAGFAPLAAHSKAALFCLVPFAAPLLLTRCSTFRRRSACRL